MQLSSAAPRAHPRRAAVAAVTLLVLAMLAAPPAVRAAGTLPMESASWHGRAIVDPQPNPRPARTAWPAGWSAGRVKLGAGSVRAGGSDRVRDVQRRLRQLGYRPGPVDGILGPRTRAATRWFQYKHGLETTGRVSRVTLAVLQARSDHEPLSSLRRTGSGTGASEPPDQTGTAPRVEAPRVADTGDTEDLALLAMVVGLALLVGLLVGAFTPQLLPARGRAAAPAPQHPTPSPSTAVFGYVTLSSPMHADEAIPMLLTVCARRGWSLARIIHDSHPASGRLGDRPGLLYALRAVRAGVAAGIVVPSLDDVAERFSDLATVICQLSDAEGFLVAADDEFDLSTPPGRAMAEAIVEIGSWPHATPGRFNRSHGRPLASRLAAMCERDIPPRAIAEALNLARIPTPHGDARWQPANVEAAIHHEHET